jgi:mono/diheme cytochrome c family protein
MQVLERALISFGSTLATCAVALALGGCSGSERASAASGTASQPSAAGAPVPVSALAADSGSAAPMEGARAISAGAPALSTQGPVAGAGGAMATAAVSGGVSYHKDIRPLLETHCLSCHVTGGSGPFPLDTWTAVNAASPTVVGAVVSGIMPPSVWKDDCQKLEDARSLTAAQKALFNEWKDAGYPEGSELEYASPIARLQKDLGTPTIVMEYKQPYTPPANADEYRCFVLDTIAEESYVTRMQISPQQADEVHDVIIFRVGAAQLMQARQLDDADSAPGYLCSGGAMVPSQNMFSYRPGSGPVTFQTGDAAYMEAGSTLIIQVHFDTAFLAKDKVPAPDRTKVQMWTLAAGKLPDRVVYRTTTSGPITLPAGEPRYVSMISYPMTQLATVAAEDVSMPRPATEFISGEIIGMTPHAHQLAKQMHASLKHADGTSSCLDDVTWDFHLQPDYLFEKGVPYSSGDTFTADCVYDNSAANQRTSDEICEHYIWLRFERAAFLKAAR